MVRRNGITDRRHSLSVNTLGLTVLVVTKWNKLGVLLEYSITKIRDKMFTLLTLILYKTLNEL